MSEEPTFPEPLEQYIDRFTRLDDILLSSLKSHQAIYNQLKALNTILTPQPPPTIHYFSYPEDGSTTSLTAGTTTINYLTGEITLPTGNPDNLTDNLQNHSLKHIHSFLILTNQTVYIRLDNNDAFPVSPGTLIPFNNQQFSLLRIRTTTVTDIFIIASTDPKGISASTSTNPATEESLQGIEDAVHAEDATHVTADKGILALGVRKDDVTAISSSDGDYTPLIINEDGILRTQAQQHLHIEECGATTDWSVLGNDTINLATTTNHVFGTLAIEFDKVNGAANTKLAGIQKTLTSVDLTPYHKGGGFFLAKYYVSNISDIDYLFLRLGTDSSNYNEWQVDVDNLSANWNSIRYPMASPDAIQGNGWNSAAITYVVIGVAFNAETDTLADIAVDHISANTGILTSADIAATITSEVSTPNINLLKVKNKVVNTQAGNVGTGTQRITIATDDINLLAIKNALETIDINKTVQTELLAITAIAADSQQKSSTLSVSHINKASIFIDHARDATAAFVGNGTEYRIEVSEKATGNDTWRTLYSVVCGIAAASDIVMDESEPAAETEIKTGATLPAVGDIVFFKNATIANSEWAKVISIDASGGTEHFDIQDGLTNTQAALAHMYNKSEQFVLNLDLKVATRLRVIVNNNKGTTNQAIVSRIACITS